MKSFHVFRASVICSLFGLVPFSYAQERLKTDLCDVRDSKTEFVANLETQFSALKDTLQKGCTNVDCRNLQERADLLEDVLGKLKELREREDADARDAAEHVYKNMSSSKGFK